MGGEVWQFLRELVVKMEMTKAKLRELARKDGLYSTPHLNDKLFLHYKGFHRIENLDEYTGLKVLWLEGNGISTIEGLDNQYELTTLYLHENAIETIEGLEACVSRRALPRVAARRAGCSGNRLPIATLSGCCRCNWTP